MAREAAAPTSEHAYVQFVLSVCNEYLLTFRTYMQREMGVSIALEG